VERVLYFTALFYGYRLYFIINGGGLILLSTTEESDKVMNAYREIQRNYQWAGDQTPIYISYLQKLFTDKNTPHEPYVLCAFIDEFKTDTFLGESREKLQSWLAKENNIENLRQKLGDFKDDFNESIEKLYTKWGD
jgi:hypothetical protein